MTQEVAEFIIYVINFLAYSQKKYPSEIYRILQSTNCIKNYIVPFYDVLHTMGTEAIAHDVLKYVTSIMICFHGSDLVVKTPDIQHSFHHLDFGKGFYVTSVKEQAKRWAKRKALLNNESKGIVSIYEFKENNRFKIKDFAEDLDTWIDFVCECRSGSDLEV